MFNISIYYILTLPVKSSRCIDRGWIWTFYWFVWNRTRWHNVPMAASEHRGALFKSFESILPQRAVQMKRFIKHPAPKPNAHSLPLCSSISLCTALWNPEEMIILDSFFFLWSRTSSPTIHSSKHGVCTHTVLYLSRPVHSENQGPVALKTVQRKWTLWMFPNWLSWLI